MRHTYPSLMKLSHLFYFHQRSLAFTQLHIELYQYPLTSIKSSQEPDIHLMLTRNLSAGG